MFPLYLRVFLQRKQTFNSYYRTVYASCNRIISLKSCDRFSCIIDRTQRFSTEEKKPIKNTGTKQRIASSPITHNVKQVLKTFRWMNKTAEEHRQGDGLGDNWKLIYNAHSADYVEIVYGGMQVISGVLIANVVYMLVNGQLSVLANHYIEAFAMGTAYIALCVPLAIVAKRYPLRMYYDEKTDEFLAILTGNIPFKLQKLKLLPNEAVPIKYHNLADYLLPWAFNSFRVRNNRPIMLVPANFAAPVYYNRLVGHH